VDDKKQSRIPDVLERFNHGFHCSQAVLSAYCEDFGLDKEPALKLSCGLAAGTARLGSTCGAVMGAYLVIGLKHGNSSPSDKSATEKTFELIQEFDRQFCQKHGSTNCRRLLGVDLRNGDKNFAIRQVKLLCPGFVQDAAEILESII
jgi:C_GCAxxG_C_C family probable redox protein